MLWFPLFPIIGHGLRDLSADQRRPVGEESSVSSSLAGWGRASRNSLNASVNTRTVSIRFWTFSMKISICVGFRGALPPRLHWSRQALWEPVGAGWSRSGDGGHEGRLVLVQVVSTVSVWPVQGQQCGHGSKFVLEVLLRVTAGSGSISEMVVIQSCSREASLSDQYDLVRFAWPLALFHRS
ncbi:hypothetical protein TIFTF001_035029 [Ficus carica]|uniref:Uncharacterized protein n=1 Tax=Ficus carica TaxID=3494 RepID=A0AA88JB97_FICCA|nr:hypothetical protein TIFTF001_035029 [Ficus carica]